MDNNEYIFKSERLGFRNWTNNDLREFTEINADPEVMEHFPSTLSEKETEDLIQRLKKHFEEREYTYFATEILKTGELIGFIGLAYQTYETEFCPATDIGWRLKKTAWGKGYATEGAEKCIEYAFEELKISKIFSVCTVNNRNSENVMKKIGMTKKGEFNHPKLKDYPEYERCLWYEINKNDG
ncbi:MAG: GNAT family N-acetyltransferase [Saprospiraceae bacterium]